MKHTGIKMNGRSTGYREKWKQLEDAYVQDERIWLIRRSVAAAAVVMILRR